MTARTKHGGYPPAPREAVWQVLAVGWRWDAGELGEREYLAAVKALLPAGNFADFMVGREAGRRFGGR